MTRPSRASTPGRCGPCKAIPVAGSSDRDRGERPAGSGSWGPRDPYASERPRRVLRLSAAIDPQFNTVASKVPLKVAAAGPVSVAAQRQWGLGGAVVG